MELYDVRKHAGSPMLRQAYNKLGDVKTLAEFREQMAGTELAPDERMRVIEQARLVLEQLYVHLPQKMATYAIDPVGQLQVLQRQVAATAQDLTDMQFHSAMVHIFRSLRDPHTRYELPSVYRDRVAFLPFSMEACYPDKGKGPPRFLASRLLGGVSKCGPSSAPFEPGAEITHWNGAPNLDAVERQADRENGSIVAARFALGMVHMTIRWCGDSLPPEEELVIIRYKSPNGRSAELLVPWCIWTWRSGTPEESNRLFPALDTDDQDGVLNHSTYLIHQSRRTFFPRDQTHELIPLPDDLGKSGSFLLSRHSGAGLEGEYGYMRIRVFQKLADDALRALGDTIEREMPSNGLIIDIRGNPGGDVTTAEAILQWLTPLEYHPAQFQLRSTELTLAASAPLKAQEVQVEDDELVKLQHRRSRYTGWHESIDQAISTGATPYSKLLPLTEEKSLRLGQRYYGPVVLVIDALTYSAADIFAAGFEDHRIGIVLGLDTSTGAGGAAATSHRFFRKLLPADERLEELPGGLNIYFALRRALRVRRNTGQVLEELGVSTRHRYWPTSNDILDGYSGLIDHCIKTLEKQGKDVRQPRSLRLKKVDVVRGELVLCLERYNIPTLEFWVDGRFKRSAGVLAQSTSFEILPMNLPEVQSDNDTARRGGAVASGARVSAGGIRLMEIRGYSDDDSAGMVARRVVDLTSAAGAADSPAAAGLRRIRVKLKTVD